VHVGRGLVVSHLHRKGSLNARRGGVGVTPRRPVLVQVEHDVDERIVQSSSLFSEGKKYRFRKTTTLVRLRMITCSLAVWVRLVRYATILVSGSNHSSSGKSPEPGRGHDNAAVTGIATRGRRREENHAFIRTHAAEVAANLVFEIAGLLLHRIISQPPQGLLGRLDHQQYGRPAINAPTPDAIRNSSIVKARRRLGLAGHGGKSFMP